MTEHNNFDQVTFAALLERAKGDRSINQYANEIDVSAAHISRLLRKLVKSPPNPDTIYKLASGTDNKVTYSALMLAAGHINDNTEEHDSDNNKIQMIENQKKFFQVILSDLYTRNFDWNLNKTSSGPADIMLEITNWEYPKWYIEIETFVTARTIFNVYGKIAAIKLTPDIKVSIAVGSKNELELFVNKPPISLRANLYIMLVDLNQGKITKEVKLCNY